MLSLAKDEMKEEEAEEQETKEDMQSVEGGEEGDDVDARPDDRVGEEEDEKDEKEEENHYGKGGDAAARVDDVVVANSKRRNILDGMDEMEREILPPKRNPAAGATTVTSSMMERHDDGGTTSHPSDDSRVVTPPSSSLSTASDVEFHQDDDDDDDDDNKSPSSEESCHSVMEFEPDHPHDRTIHDNVANISANSYDSAEDGEMQQVSLGSNRSGGNDGSSDEDVEKLTGVYDAAFSVYKADVPMERGGMRNYKSGCILDMEDEEEEDHDNNVSSDDRPRRLHPRDIIIDDNGPPVEEPFKGLEITPNSSPFDEPYIFLMRDRPPPPPMPPSPTTKRTPMASPLYLLGDDYTNVTATGSINVVPYVVAKNRNGEDRIAMNVDTDTNTRDNGRNKSRYVDRYGEDEVTDPGDVLTQLSDAVLFGQTPKVLSQFMSDLMGSAKWGLSRPAASVQQQGSGGGGVGGGGARRGHVGSSVYINEADQIDDTGPIKIGDKLYSHSEAIQRWRKAKTKLSDRYFDFDNDGNVKVEHTSFFDRSSLFQSNDEKVVRRKGAKDGAEGGVVISLDELVIRCVDAKAEEVIVIENSVAEKDGDDDSEMNMSSDKIIVEDSVAEKDEDDGSEMNMSCDEIIVEKKSAAEKDGDDDSEMNMSSDEIIVKENSVAEKDVDDDSDMNMSCDLHLSTTVRYENHRSTLSPLTIVSEKLQGNSQLSCNGQTTDTGATLCSPPSSSHEIEDVESVRNVIYELQQTQQQLENVKSDLHLFKQQKLQFNSIKKPTPSTLPSSSFRVETNSSASHSSTMSETDEDSDFDTFHSYANSEEVCVAMTKNGFDDKNIRGINIIKVDSDNRKSDKSENTNAPRSTKNMETDSVMGSTYGVEVEDALVDRNRSFELGKIGYKSAGKSVCEQSVLGSQYGTEVVFNPPTTKRVVVTSRKPRTSAGHNMGVKIAADSTTAAVMQHVMKANLAMKQTAGSSPRRTGVMSPSKLSTLPLKKLKLGAKISPKRSSTSRFAAITILEN